MLFHAFLLLAAMAMAMAMVVVSTTASSVVPVTDEQYRRDVNMTRFTNASMVDGDVNYETYHCFLCTGRHPLLSHMCPIYWDECHLECWDAIDPDAPAPPALPSAAAADHSMDTAPGNLECYVLKVYNSGRYVVVQRLNCAVVAPYACFLTCGGGELDERKVTTTIQQQGSFALPSELCNSQDPWCHCPLAWHRGADPKHFLLTSRCSWMSVSLAVSMELRYCIPEVLQPYYPVRCLGQLYAIGSMDAWFISSPHTWMDSTSGLAHSTSGHISLVQTVSGFGYRCSLP